MQVSGLEKQLQKHDAALVREQKTAQRLVDTEASRAAAQEALESERQTWQREKMQFQLRVDELLMLLQDARQVCQVIIGFFCSLVGLFSLYGRSFDTCAYPRTASSRARRRRRGGRISCRGS